MIVIMAGHVINVEPTGRVTENDAEIGRVAQEDGEWAAWISGEVTCQTIWWSDGHDSQAAALTRLVTHVWGESK